VELLQRKGNSRNGHGGSAAAAANLSARTRLIMRISWRNAAMALVTLIITAVLTYDRSEASSIGAGISLNNAVRTDVTTTNGEVIPSPRKRSCLQRLFNATYPALNQQLAAHPDENGVKPLRLVPTNNSAEGEVLFLPGLQANFFRGRRMVLLGDSTLFYMTKWLDVLLLMDTNTSGFSHTNDINQPPTITLSQANALVESHPANKQVDVAGFTRPRKIIKPEDGTHIEWIGMAGLTEEPALTNAIRSMFEQSKLIQPEIIVFNFGIHWMQSCPTRCPTDPSIVFWWAHYQDWLQSGLKLAKQVNANILLFKTVNYICRDAFRGNFQSESRAYQDQDPNQLESCQATLKPLVNNHTEFPVSTQDTNDFCRYGSLTEIGSQHFNQQINAFVKNLEPMENLTVAVYNDHDVESCSYTKEGDGRHYHNLNLLRLRSMANLIQGIESCTALEDLHR